jgi:hypothetical protein
MVNINWIWRESSGWAILEVSIPKSYRFDYILYWFRNNFKLFNIFIEILENNFFNL